MKDAKEPCTKSSLCASLDMLMCSALGPGSLSVETPVPYCHSSSPALPTLTGSFRMGSALAQLPLCFPRGGHSSSAAQVQPYCTQEGLGSSYGFRMWMKHRIAGCGIWLSQKLFGEAELQNPKSGGANILWDKPGIMRDSSWEGTKRDSRSVPFPPFP